MKQLFKHVTYCSLVITPNLISIEQSISITACNFCRNKVKILYGLYFYFIFLEKK